MNLKSEADVDYLFVHFFTHLKWTCAAQSAVPPLWEPCGGRAGGPWWKNHLRASRVFFQRVETVHNSRKLHLWGAPLSSVAAGPELRCYFPPFNHGSGRPGMTERPAAEVALPGLRLQPAPSPPSRYFVSVKFLACSVLSSQEGKPFFSGIQEFRINLCKEMQYKSKKLPRAGLGLLPVTLCGS